MPPGDLSGTTKKKRIGRKREIGKQIDGRVIRGQRDAEKRSWSEK